MSPSNLGKGYVDLTTPPLGHWKLETQCAIEHTRLLLAFVSNYVLTLYGILHLYFAPHVWVIRLEFHQDI